MFISLILWCQSRPLNPRNGPQNLNQKPQLPPNHWHLHLHPIRLRLLVINNLQQFCSLRINIVQVFVALNHNLLLLFNQLLGD